MNFKISFSYEFRDFHFFRVILHPFAISKHYSKWIFLATCSLQYTPSNYQQSEVKESHNFIMYQHF